MSAEQFAISSHYEAEFKKDPEAIFHEVHSEEQEKSYSCGPAVLVDVLKTLGKDVDQLVVINEVRKEIRNIRPEKSKESIASLGTPPEVLQAVLKNHGITFETKDSVSDITAEEIEKSEEYLDQKLKEGYIVITPVQTIPNYGHERKLEEDGHYLIVCGSVTINGKKAYITVDPMFHYYQRGSNENWVYGMHQGDSVTDKTPKVEPEIEYETVETRTIEYSNEDLAKFKIDPTKYGLRLISAGNFMRNWKDVSGFGKPFNHFGIAIKTQGL